MHGPHPAAALFFLKAWVHSWFKRAKKMLKCRSTCSVLVFVLKKTLQALDDMPKDHLHKKDSFTLLKDLTNIKVFLSYRQFFDTSSVFGLFPVIIPTVAHRSLITCKS